MAEMTGPTSLDASYRVLFRQHPMAMWVFELDTLRFLDVNDAATRVYGYSRDEFLAMTVADIRPASELERLLADIAAVHDEWDRRPDTWVHRKKNGGLMTVRITAHAVDFAGRRARLVMSEDVTERVATEARLLAARDIERRMRFALDAAHVGTWEADLLTGSVYWSETCEALYGLTAGTFGGTFEAFVARVHPDDRQQVLDAVGRAKRHRGVTEFEFRTIWPDKTEHWLHKIVQCSFDESGTPVGAAGVATDVTGRRLLEQQLQQSQKMESLGQLAGSVAHDFNNMLTAILGNAAFLLEELAPSDPRRRGVHDIQHAGQRAASLTGQLLAFSRKKVVSPRPLRIASVLETSTPMIRRLMGESIQLQIAAADSRCVTADPAQLEQVLVNLAVNARDAMPEGGHLTIATGDVVLDAHAQMRAGAYTMLRVTDTGHGMTAATRKRVFEPFFTTKEPGKGTGLGLATVYGAIKQCGGSIEVQSAPGRGTTFTIYLPQTADAEVRDEIAAPTRQSLRGRETVLVVEDEPAVRSFTVVVLQRHGYTVHAVGTSREALDWIAAGRGIVDLLLTDVVLPDMKGPAMARRLQQQMPLTKVLYMSGYAPGERGDALELKPFVAKPFTPEALVRAVREALDVPAASAAAVSNPL